jgi:FSR family fosmidomycin resistance protein-like MFS transporter
MSPFRNRRLLSLTFAHFMVDFYSGALPLLIAAQTAPLALDERQIGLVAFANRLTASLPQPLFGPLADRARAPLLALAGIFWQAVFFGLAGFSRRYETFLLLATIAGFGSAAFHPPGAGGVPRVSPRSQRNGSMGVFLVGGTMGYAVGPLVAGFAFAALGPRGTALFVLGALLASPVLVLSLRRLRYEAGTLEAASEAGPEDGGQISSLAALPLGLLALLVVFRSWVIMSMSTYLPQYVLQQGAGLVFGGNISFAFLIAAAVGNLAAGFLSDRVGRLNVTLLSLLASGPLLYLMLRTGGVGIFAFAFVLGLCLHASMPLTLLMAQEVMPDRPGVITGFTLGFTFVAGGVGVAITGVIAEQIGLVATLNWLAVLPLLGALSTAALAVVERQPRPATG